MVNNKETSTVSFNELKQLMDPEAEKEFLEDIKDIANRDGGGDKNRNVQIRIISFATYEANKFWDEVASLNYEKNYAIVDAIGEEAFREFSDTHRGKRMNIWLHDPDVVDRKNRNEKIISDFLAGENSYDVLARRHGTTTENVRQIICRHRKKQMCDT